MDICVGNLPCELTARNLREIFEFYGRVATAQVVGLRVGEQSKGLGFVSMPAREEAVLAVLGVHGKIMKGQAITANEVQPRGPVSGVCGRRCPCCSENAASGNTYHISAEFHRPGAGHDAGKKRRQCPDSELRENPSASGAEDCKRLSGQTGELC